MNEGVFRPDAQGRVRTVPYAKLQIAGDQPASLIN